VVEATRSYRAEQVSVTDARRFVADTVRGWGFDDEVSHDAALCTAELVTNAILHAATPIDLTVRLHDRGVHVAIRDQSTRRVSALVSTVAPGEVGGLSDETMSGRGLLVVESIASAWGVDYGAAEKTVWFTLGDAGGGDPDAGPEPEPARPAGAVRTLRLVAVPVRLSISSGQNVDDVVREFQLLAIDDAHARRVSPSLVTEVDRALRASAPGRNASRAAAAAALAKGDERYDLVIQVGPRAGDQLDRLNELLEEVGALCREGVLLCLAPGADVIAFRRWCALEVHAQVAGADPAPCPFDA
jgi:anti-sigma regulatory factor (Ser/Thr protein kinase)